MPMPETAVNKNSSFVFRKNNIRFSRVSPVILSETEPLRKKIFPDHNFNTGILSLYSAHVPASSFRSQGIAHYSFPSRKRKCMQKICFNDKKPVFQYFLIYRLQSRFLSSSVIFLITLHGFPTATELSGISFTTTLPAPITTLLPIVTLGST